MDTWSNFKTLAETDPLKKVERLYPEFYKKYAGLEDEFGFDMRIWGLSESYVRFLYEDYFKVDIRGLENIPPEGRGIVVGNHSGTLPVDGAMLAMALARFHSSPRRVRYMTTDWFFQIPFLKDWITATGNVRGSLENANKLLANGELVGIYPEGIRGVGKPFRQRYRMLDYHYGFVQLAISSQTPIIPIATIGGDEILPNFTNLKDMATYLRFPYFPVTWAFPWLPFPLYLVPLPVSWLIEVGKPIDLGYPPEKAKDRKLCVRIARDIQYDVQRSINRLLRERKSVFTGWEPEENEK